jgi:hypothetical protein
MILFAAEASEIREGRVQVDANRVACWRIGSVELDRCRECLNLLRLDVAGELPSGHVVCADSYLEAETEFAW